MGKAAFSVIYYPLYYPPDRPGERWAADWDFWNKNKWDRSWSSIHGPIRWCPEEGLDEEAREAILNHFGLKEWEKDYPLEKVEKMSPSQLIKERREKEREFNLPKLEVFSDTLGDHQPAEDY